MRKSHCYKKQWENHTVTKNLGKITLLLKKQWENQIITKKQWKSHTVTKNFGHTVTIKTMRKSLCYKKLR